MTISRQGNGNRLPSFELNLNRSKLKVDEASNLLSRNKMKSVFSDHNDHLLTGDVGVAPAGWTGLLANYQKKVSVIALDHSELD